MRVTWRRRLGVAILDFHFSNARGQSWILAGMMLDCKVHHYVSIRWFWQRHYLMSSFHMHIMKRIYQILRHEKSHSWRPVVGEAILDSRSLLQWLHCTRIEEFHAEELLVILTIEWKKVIGGLFGKAATTGAIETQGGEAARTRMRRMPHLECTH